MKINFTLFCLALLLGSCALESANKNSAYHSLTLKDYTDGYYINNPEPIKPHMLFVHFTNSTKRYESKLVPMPTRPIWSSLHTPGELNHYEVVGYFDRDGCYVKLRLQKPILIMPFSSADGKVILIKIDK